MASSSAGGELGGLLEKMTLNVTKTLEKKLGITDVRLIDKSPAEKSVILTWEQKNMCFLPNDLKDFYSTTDGILIEWSVLFDGGNLPLGKMEVNSIGKLTPLHGTQPSNMASDNKPSLLDLDDISDEEDTQGNKKPRFNDSCKSFELDNCSGFAKVCLVYKDIKTTGVTDCNAEIWLLDRSLKWSYLALSFQQYFRMLIVHLGIPLWQYRFTPAGLSPETKQWFNMYCPSRLVNDKEINTDHGESGEFQNHLDATRVFKGKHHDSARNMQKQVPKKKVPSNSKTNLSSRYGSKPHPKY